MARLKKIGGGTVGIKGGVIALGRTDLSKVMYETARKHSDLAKEAAGKDAKSELENSLVAILLAYSALEAYINIYGQDHLPTDTWEDKFRKPRASTESKWIGIPREVTGKALNKGKEPFKSFLRLEELREYIAHFNPHFVPFVETKRGGLTEARSKLNYENAIWACKTAKQMIASLHKLDSSKSPDWLS